MEFIFLFMICLLPLEGKFHENRNVALSVHPLSQHQEQDPAQCGDLVNICYIDKHRKKSDRQRTALVIKSWNFIYCPNFQKFCVAQINLGTNFTASYGYI